MAKLKDVLIIVKDQFGESHSYQCPLSVTEDGVFSMGYPDKMGVDSEVHKYMKEYVNNYPEKMVLGSKKLWFYQTKTTIKVRCTSFDALKAAFHLALEALHKYTVEECLVIAFASHASYNFCTDKQGNGYYENGCQLPKGVDYQWQMSKIEDMSFARNAMYRMLGVTVSVMTKKTIQSSCGRFVAVKYTRYMGDNHFRIENDPIKKLALVGGIGDFEYFGHLSNFDKKNDLLIYKHSKYQEIPCTDQAAVFFSNLVAQVSVLGYRLNAFLHDSLQVTAMIESGQVGAIGWVKGDDQ